MLDIAPNEFFLEEIVFLETVIKRMAGRDVDSWAVFTKEPANQKGYVWWVNRYEHGGHILSPMWVKETRKKLVGRPLAECIKLALSYERSYADGW
jgi:hypothetical protein